MKTYYTLEEENALVNTVMSTTIDLNPIIPNSHKDGSTLLDYIPQNIIQVRFQNKNFLRVPIQVLAMSEVLLIAEQNGWRREIAQQNKAYLEFTEQTRNYLSRKEERATLFTQKFLQGKQSNRIFKPTGIQHAHTFVPVYSLVRNDEQAYFYYLNNINRGLGTGKLNSRLYNEMVIDLGSPEQSFSLENSAFYCAEQNHDLQERDKLRKLMQ